MAEVMVTPRPGPPSAPPETHRSAGRLYHQRARKAGDRLGVSALPARSAQDPGMETPRGPDPHGATSGSCSRRAAGAPVGALDPGEPPRGRQRAEALGG